MAVMLPARKPNVALQASEEPILSERVWTLPFIGLVIFLGVYYLSPEDFVPGLEGIPFAKVIAIATFIAAIKGNISNGRPWLVFEKEAKLFLIWCAIMILGVPFSIWPGGSIELLTTQIFRILMLILLFGNCLQTPKQATMLVRVIVVFGIIIAAVSFSHYLAGQLDHQGRLIGYGSKEYENPNDLSVGLLIMIPLAAVLSVHHSHLAMRMLYVLAMGLMVAVILLSLSRTGMVGLAFLSGLFVWEMGKRNPIKAFSMCSLVIALVVVVAQVSPTIADRADSIFDSEKDASGSKAERLSQMSDGLSLATEHPVLGVGLGMSVVGIVGINNGAADRWVKIHNTYLLIAAELGLPGLVMFLVIIISTIRNLKARCTLGLDGNSKSHLEESVLGALRKALLVLVVTATFSPIAYNFFFYILIGLSGAIVSALSRSEAHSLLCRTDRLSA